MHANRFIVRDFTFSEEEIVQQRQEMDTAATTEKETMGMRLTMISLN